MRVVLIIGHKKNSPGACDKNQERCEFMFNETLANNIKDKIGDNYEVFIVYRTTYKNLPWDVNILYPDLVVSLHANAYNTKATGTEVLHYKTSKRGKKIAQIFQDNMVSVLGLRDRGIRGKGTEDRGGYILRYTNAPCVLLEPFFIDNDNDYAVVMDKYDAFVATIEQSIYDALEVI